MPGTNIISKKLSRIYLKHFDLAPIYAEKMRSRGYEVHIHIIPSELFLGTTLSVVVDVMRKR